MNGDTDTREDWLAVVARSLAFLCLSEAELRDKDLLPQAQFLQRLGLSRKEAATLLGSTADSLGVLERRARKAKKPARAKRNVKKVKAKR